MGNAGAFQGILAWLVVKAHRHPGGHQSAQLEASLASSVADELCSFSGFFLPSETADTLGHFSVIFLACHLLPLHHLVPSPHLSRTYLSL